MRKLIYTIITGGYDQLNPCPKFPGWEYLLITDNPHIDHKGWPLKVVPEDENPIKLQRFWKINSHILDYDLTVYVDGSMKFKIHDPIAIVQKYFKGGICLIEHPTRKCIVPEMQAILTQNKDRLEIVRRQVGKYIGECMPLEYGMYASGMMIRDNKLKELEELWWNEVKEHSHRDQLSLPYALWKTGVKPVKIPWTTLTSYVDINQHLQKKELKIWYSNPYSTSKNMGKAYNDFCAIVPNDEDWIVMQDGDMQYLTPDWGRIINETLNANGEKFALFGCITNRLAGKHQLHNGEISEDFNLQNHIEIAKTYSGAKATQVKGIAGVFMAFQKKTWKKVGGFNENVRYFDSDFSNAVAAHGGKIAVMNGLYIFHQYRPWSDNPTESYKHLENV